MAIGFHIELASGIFPGMDLYRWPYQPGDRVKLTRICELTPPGSYKVADVVNEFLIIGSEGCLVALGPSYAEYVEPQPDLLAPLVTREEQIQFAEKHYDFNRRQARRRKRKGKRKR